MFGWHKTLFLFQVRKRKWYHLLNNIFCTSISHVFWSALRFSLYFVIVSRKRKFLSSGLIAFTKKVSSSSKLWNLWMWPYQEIGLCRCNQLTISWYWRVGPYLVTDALIGRGKFGARDTEEDSMWKQIGRMCVSRRMPRIAYNQQKLGERHRRDSPTGASDSLLRLLHLILNFWHQNSENKFLWFQATQFVIIC